MRGLPVPLPERLILGGQREAPALTAWKPAVRGLSVVCGRERRGTLLSFRSLIRNQFPEITKKGLPEDNLTLASADPFPCRPPGAAGRRTSVAGAASQRQGTGRSVAYWAASRPASALEMVASRLKFRPGGSLTRSDLHGCSWRQGAGPRVTLRTGLLRGYPGARYAPYAPFTLYVRLALYVLFSLDG
jgi:hypothetical protein